MKGFKIIHERIIYHNGDPYVYNVFHKGKNMDLLTYCNIEGLQVDKAIAKLNEYMAYISPKTLEIHFMNYELVKEFVEDIAK